MHQQQRTHRPGSKKIRAALLATGVLVFAEQAFADTQIYGIADAAVRYSSNSNPKKDSLLEMSQGPITGSRLGLKGNEDLGNGMKAFYVLESGFDLGNGNMLQGTSAAGYGQASSGGQGRLFGRQAYVGLGGAFGELSFGRQYGHAYQAMGISQVFGNPNLDTVIIVANYTGSRQDNMVKYQGNLGGLKLGLHYTFGEVAGDRSANGGKGIALGYTIADLDLSATHQTLANATGSDVRNTSGLAAAYKFGQFRTSFGYLRNTYDVSATENDIFIGGLGYAPSSQWSLGIGAFVDKQKDPRGKRKAVYAMASYMFSKNTDVYVQMDHNRITGGYRLITSQGATGDKFGVSLGLRTRF